MLCFSDLGCPHNLRVGSYRSEYFEGLGVIIVWGMGVARDPDGINYSSCVSRAWQSGLWEPGVEMITKVLGKVALDGDMCSSLCWVWWVIQV